MADPGKMDAPVARPGVAAAREVKVQVRLTRTAADRIDQLAEQEERTRSDMVRVLLREALDARTSPAPRVRVFGPTGLGREAVRDAEPQEAVSTGKTLSKVEQAKAMKAAKYR